MRLAGPPGWRGSSRQLAADGLLAVGLVVAELTLTALQPDQLGPVDWWATVAWSIVCAAPVMLRRVAPWLAVLLCLIVLAGPVLLFRQYPMTHALTFVVVTYTTAARLPLRPAVAAALVLWLPVAAINVVDRAAPNSMQLSPGYLVLYNALVALVSFLVGRTVYTRRAVTQALQERARAAEANQRDLAAQAVADERRRIARELHDVVAHHVAVMGVLATGARRVLRRDPDAADEALGTIEGTGRTALREMRRLLDVLRTDAEEPAAELTPQPGLAGITPLVDQVRDAGLPVTLRVQGSPGTLDPGVALTIYRIVQEALTNALKHAGSATAEVRLTFGVYWLIVEVLDDGHGPAPDAGAGAGHGLVGMRERVALYGGRLLTGPRPGGGYRVHAKFPMDELNTKG
ncbi:MAG TPA: sensor histidine kinase [Catenuloplanes sp.]|jgi:signal transduction histidine kinase